VDQQQIYQTWKTKVLATKKVVGDGQCVSLVVNNTEAYTEALFPGIDWETIFKSVPEAQELFGDDNPKYFTAITNDHSNPNQLPEQGDIMIFGATPAEGYTNLFVNDAGHCGVCDSASPSGYVLFQQNAPETSEAPNVTAYAWYFRPCIGWLRPVLQKAPAETPTPVVEPKPVSEPVQTITLPVTTGPWHLYKRGGPYNPTNLDDVLGVISPEEEGRPLTYNIIESLGDGVYVIDSSDYGVGALYTKGSDVIIK
jgi:hypothetical protein